MKRNLLQIVQAVGNSLDLDRINDVHDTPEALQIVDLARDVYEEISVNQDWRFKHTLTALSSVSDADKPTHMIIPDNTAEVKWIKYNKRRLSDTRERIQHVEYQDPEEFLQESNGLNTDNANVKQVFDFSGVPIFIRTDRSPSYWTSFDDKFIVMDSYDSEVDTTLNASKTQAYITQLEVFEYRQDYIPVMPEAVFPHFMAELKSVASMVIKQQMNEKFEQQSRRQRRWLYQRGNRTGEFIQFPDYGRKSKIGNKFLDKLPQ